MNTWRELLFHQVSVVRVPFPVQHCVGQGDSRNRCWDRSDLLSDGTRPFHFLLSEGWVPMALQLGP